MAAAAARPRTHSQSAAILARVRHNFTFPQLEALWVQVGGDPKEAETAAAVAMAESGGNPTAVGRNTNGSVDRGLWQINSVHGNLSTTNIEANARAAVQIHKESGWDPWVTYKNGAYMKFTSPSYKPMSTLDIITGTAEGSVEKVEKAAESFTVSNLQGFGVMIVLVLLGAALVFYGIIVMVRPRDKAFSIPKMPVPSGVPEDVA